MNAGTSVRLKSDPGKRGVTTGKSKSKLDRKLIQVRFPNSVEYVPEDQLEIPEQSRENPLDLLEEGRLSLAKDLRRIITHVRLSGRLANLIYSMEITNTDFYAYQFKPVLKLLNSATNGILIADEVGLGKTIESGLIWTELRLRYDFRRLFVLCPALLRGKWQLELRQRFGIEAEILDATEALQALTNARQQVHYASFAIIASMQGLRPRKGWDDEESGDGSPSSEFCRFLAEQEHDQPLIDVLIIDEAHYLRNPESKTAALGKLLRDVSDYTILLSATPIHLRNDDLYQLLNLVDENTFNHRTQFENILTANAPLTRARDLVLLKKVSRQELLQFLNQARQHPLLSENRQLQALLTAPPTDEELHDPERRSALAHRLDTMNILGHAVTRTRKREVTEWRVLREPFAEKIPLSPPESEFYEKVTHLVREFCAKYDRHEGFLLVTPQLQMCSSMPAALREWQRRKNEFLSRLSADEDFDPEKDVTAEPLVLEIISQVGKLGRVDELEANDSKFGQLQKVLTRILDENPGEKIIVFSRFRATLEYLNERLSTVGIRTILMMGGKEFDKDAIVKEFARPKGPSVLLSSEVGSEGIDLQFCRIIVNYDLPWNPMKIEQRIGRVDRLGQKAEKVLIWNLFYKDTIDGRVYSRLLERLHVFEYALGGLEPVIGEEIEKLTYELLSRQFTPEQENARIDQTALALENKQRMERELEENASQLVAYGDYILHQINAAKDLNRWINAKDIQIYITDFFGLHYSGCQFKQLKEDELDYEIQLTNQAKHDLEQFFKETRYPDSTAFIRNDPAPVRCRFENKLVVSHHIPIEIINQAHPLVRFVCHTIEKNEEYSYPAVSVRLDAGCLPADFVKGIYVFTVQKWRVHGLQEIEQLQFAAVYMKAPERLLPDQTAEKLVLTAALHGKDWLQARHTISLDSAARYAWEYCLPHSDRLYEAYVTEMQNKNADRADIQEKNLDRHLKNQLAKLNEVLEKHTRLGRASLAKATEGKVIKLKNRVERKMIEIRERREIHHSKDLICTGIVKVD
ncbi:MAG: DEAD/DEAH box helicase [candidate division KSB1 bacterium]|nr:DEAD/DEAH box helicase [candidate division KSB1 bacterium]MDZ7367844.1 DEAD/DEAH box helicase [candidate division KSB1 bacterium]MDZ7405520.1 DEAD/DEAH box helicase [candidate division KSB1 bacterium]